VVGGGFIPPQERMYAGGPTTVRGYQQNELGAVTYIAARYDTVAVIPPGGTSPITTYQVTGGAYRRAVPVGGNSLVVANAELRFRSPFLSDLLQFAVFGDAGEVWVSGTSLFENFRLKFTPGVQVAALTPVGPIRVILGYNPYRRPNGPIYFENTAASGGQLVCVSPNNTLPVVDGVQQAGACPQFTPARTQSFRSRLTLSLAIGQAF
jgi:outer membrane protein insertion porin family/translocation and assembly module TamA